MLSWSSRETGVAVDLGALAVGRTGVGLEHGDELLRFATACGGRDDRELESAREALVTAAGESFMVDAAAVAANFEMMTRLADGTGAALPPSRLAHSVREIQVMQIGDLPSRR